MYTQLTHQKKPIQISYLLSSSPRTAHAHKKMSAWEERRTSQSTAIRNEDNFRFSGAQPDKVNMSKAQKDYDLKLKTLRLQASVNHIASAENKSKALLRVINKEMKSQNSAMPELKLNVGGQITNNPEDINFLII